MNNNTNILVVLLFFFDIYHKCYRIFLSKLYQKGEFIQCKDELYFDACKTHVTLHKYTSIASKYDFIHVLMIMEMSSRSRDHAFYFKRVSVYQQNYRGMNVFRFLCVFIVGSVHIYGGISNVSIQTVI